MYVMISVPIDGQLMGSSAASQRDAVACLAVHAACEARCWPVLRPHKPSEHLFAGPMQPESFDGVRGEDDMSRVGIDR